MNSIQNFNNTSQQQQQFTINRQLQSSNLTLELSSSTQSQSGNLGSYELSSNTKDQLMIMIQGKDKQILRLTETLQILRKQNAEKTNQAQLWRSKVAQIKKDYNCLQKKFGLSGQKTGLLKQINERLYGQNVELEKSMERINKQIIEIKEQMKAQDSANSIKLAQMRAEINQERKRNKQHVKQIKILKAIIKELEEDLQEQDKDQDGDYDDNQCIQGKNSIQTADSGEINNDENNLPIQQNFNKHRNHSRGSNSLPNSFEFTKSSIDQQLQQNEIVFAQA